MATTLEKTGKTVEDALQAALKELGVSAEDVEVEVLETPSKGIFGLFGTKPAKIKVTVKEILPPPVETKPAEKIVEFTAKVEEVAQPVDETPKVEEPPKVDAVVEIVEEASETAEVVETEKPPADKAEIIAAAKKFLSDVFAAMKINIEMSDRELESGRVVIDLRGQNLGPLIGKRGQNLEALQYLMNLAANRIHSSERLHILLDVEDYREQRAATLKRIAKSAADRAIRTGRDVKMEPMNRSERRFVHTMLQDNDKIETHSAGEDPYRYIIISPKKRGR